MQTVIGQIGIFMICAQAIMHFRPKEVYGKYLRLLFSVMILVQILQPFATFFFGESKLNLQKSVQEFQEMLDESMVEAVNRAATSEKQLEQMSLEVVQERAAQQETMEQGDLEGTAGEQKIEIAPIEEIHITREDENE